MKEKIIVGLMVGSMIFSVFGTGLIIWLGGQDAQEPIFSELGIVDLVEGEGEVVDDVSDIVTVNYVGTLASNGVEFDSNEGSDPISFPLSGVIEGWKEGLIGMKVGGKRKLEVPSSKGYGVTGSGASIPPNADLIFEVELLEIENVDPVEESNDDQESSEQ